MPATRPQPTVELKVASVELDDEAKTIRIDNLVIDEPEVFEFLEDAPPSDRTGLVARALRVGSVALRGASTAANVDYVQKQFDRLKQEFAEKLTAHFGPKGDVTTLLQETFGEDGELEVKLQAFLSPEGQFSKVLDSFLGDEGTVQALLGEDGDFHTRLDAYFGEKGVLRAELDKTFGDKGGQLYDILSHTNERGPVGAFMRELKQMFNPDVEGSPLHQVRAEIRQQFSHLLRQLGFAEGEEQEKRKGHGKGRDFEEWVFDTLEATAGPFGDAVDDVGDKAGLTRKRGDAVVTLDHSHTGGVDMRIAFESKNKPVTLRGKATIYQELDEVMTNRQADFAVAVVHPDHAKDEFTPFRYRAPNMILCVADEEAGALPVQVAYRLARTILLNRRSSDHSGLDHETVNSVVTRITAKLTEFSAIYTKITNLQSGMTDIRTMLENIKQSVHDELQGLLMAAEAPEE